MEEVHIEKSPDSPLNGDLFFKTGTIDIIKGEDGNPYWEGVLSSTSIDYDNERLSRKALDMAASDLLTNSTIFFNHKHDGLGVGKIVKTWVVDQGNLGCLKIRIQPSKAAGVQDVVTQVNEGVLKCLSIGGKKLKSYEDFDADTKKSVTVIDGVKALEGSVVGIGANPDAMLYSVAKSYFINAFKKEVDSMPCSEEKKEEKKEEEKKEEAKKSVDPLMSISPQAPTTVKGEYLLKCPNCGNDIKVCAATTPPAAIDPATGGGSSATLSGSGTQAPTPNEPALFTTPTQTTGTKGVFLTEEECEVLLKAADVIQKRPRKGLVEPPPAEKTEKSAQLPESSEPSGDPQADALKETMYRRLGILISR